MQKQDFVELDKGGPVYSLLSGFFFGKSQEQR